MSSPHAEESGDIGGLAFCFFRRHLDITRREDGGQAAVREFLSLDAIQFLFTASNCRDDSGVTKSQDEPVIDTVR